MAAHRGGLSFYSRPFVSRRQQQRNLAASTMPSRVATPGRQVHRLLDAARAAQPSTIPPTSSPSPSAMSFDCPSLFLFGHCQFPACQFPPLRFSESRSRRHRNRLGCARRRFHRSPARGLHDQSSELFAIRPEPLPEKFDSKLYIRRIEETTAPANPANESNL